VLYLYSTYVHKIYKPYCDMNIKLDERTCDNIYVDRLNLHTANTSEIIKLVTDDKSCAWTIANIFAGYYSLSKIESVVLKICILYNTIDISYLIKLCTSLCDRSDITIKRAIVKLKKRHLVYESDDRIKCNIDISNDKLNKAKFIVIELK